MGELSMTEEKPDSSDQRESCSLFPSRNLARWFKLIYHSILNIFT
jgi:hypothetical protein